MIPQTRISFLYQYCAWGGGPGGKGKALRITFYIQNNTRALLGRQWGINAGHLRDDYAESIGTLSLGGSTARRVPLCQGPDHVQ